MARKPVTAIQEMCYVASTVVLIGSPLVGAALVYMAYMGGMWPWDSALLLGGIPSVCALLVWLDTEVRWQKRLARYAQIKARIVR